MLNFKVENKSTTVMANGTHSDMLAEAISLETQLHRFVYRLGHLDYIIFLMELEKITKSNDFMDFLEKEPDDETRIQIPILHKDGDKDAE